MLAKFFIERPVLANVIAFVTILLGAVAAAVLPVSQYPPITPPTVQVTTTYPGASAKILVETVALPIEQQVNGVEKMLYMQSNCTSDGRYTLTVTFQVGTDLDFAQVLVQNRVAAAMAQLPAPVQQQGVVTKKKETSPLQIITLSSTDDRFDALFLSNFATLQLHDKLARLPGVGDVTVFGVGEYSMRVWLDPQQMYQRGLMPSDVVSALQAQNAYVAAGQVGMPPTPSGQDFQFTANVPAALSDASEFDKIILKTAPGGLITRVQDVGRVELGARSYSQVFRMDGRPAGGIAIYQLPGANALDTAKGVRKLLAALAPGFPAGLAYEIPFDTTTFVMGVGHGGVPHAVRGWGFGSGGDRGVSAGLAGDPGAGDDGAGDDHRGVCGDGGFGVLDQSADAVCGGAGDRDRGGRRDRGGGRGGAARRARPDAEAGVDRRDEGADGADHRDHSGVDVGVSAAGVHAGDHGADVPAVCAGDRGDGADQCGQRVDAEADAVRAVAAGEGPEPQKEQLNWFFRAFNAVYEPLERWYTGVIRFMVARSGRMALIALVLIGVAGWGLTKVPTGFIPTEDQGYLMVAVQMPDGASLERTQKVMDEVSRIGLGIPGSAHAIAIGTGGPSPLDGDVSLANAGIVYVMLKNWSDRGKGEDLAAISGRLVRDLSTVQEAHTRVLVPPPIQGLGASNGFQMQVELTDGSYDFERLQRITDRIVHEANAAPEVRDAFTSFRASVPQVTVQVDKTHAANLGVNLGDVYNTVQAYLGSTFVNLFTRFGHNYMVYLQADPLRRVSVSDVKDLYVRNSAGAMVPVGAVADIHPTVGTSVISLYNLFPAATINGMPARGYSSGQALSAMETIARRELPRGMGFEWTAMSYQERLVGSSSYFIFALSLLLVYFVLAGQYESWITPAAVILAVPMALLGTTTALRVAGFDNNIYVQIGLVLLIALSAKNAILIVEMGREGRAAGRSIEEATVEASRVRFRPILMTSFTFILGVLPLVLASGAGAAARRSLGLAVAAGMLASTGLAVLFVPSLFVVLQRWIERKGTAKAPTGVAAPSPAPTKP